MLKTKPKTEDTPQKLPITLNAVAAFKTENGSNFLCESVELKIVDGVVVDVVRLNRGPDLPAIAVGAASRVLWNQMKTNTYKGQ